MKKLSIMLDVDNVLTDATGQAIDLYNKEHNTDLKLEEVSDYNVVGTPFENMLQYFHEKEFILSLKVMDWANELVRKLIADGHDVFFCTAVYTDVMDARVEWLHKNFPEVPKSHFILTQYKDLIATDVIVDDSIENIRDSRATNKLLFRRPWNMFAEYPAASTLEDVYAYISNISNSEVMPKINEASVVCLVGPSASGKTELQKRLCKHPLFEKPVSCTTREQRTDEKHGEDYYFISLKKFKDLVCNNEFIEYASYAGEHYGMRKEEIEDILKSGKKAVMVAEITGANVLKREFGDKCITIFVERPKVDIVSSILERDISNKEKVKRLVNIEDEYKNIRFCDYAIINNKPLDEMVNQIFSLIS